MKTVAAVSAGGELIDAVGRSPVVLFDRRNSSGRLSALEAHRRRGSAAGGLGRAQNVVICKGTRGRAPGNLPAHHKPAATEKPRGSLFTLCCEPPAGSGHQGPDLTAGGGLPMFRF